MIRNIHLSLSLEASIFNSYSYPDYVTNNHPARTRDIQHSERELTTIVYLPQRERIRRASAEHTYFTFPLNHGVFFCLQEEYCDRMILCRSRRVGAIYPISPPTSTFQLLRCTFFYLSVNRIVDKGEVLSTVCIVGIRGWRFSKMIKNSAGIWYT